MTLTQYKTTVGHTGIARLCLAQQCYRTRTKLAEVGEDVTVSGYTVYFWSNENNEPIHVHVTKGKPTPNATKIWLTKSGGCIVASNGSKISNKNQRLDIT